MSQVSYKIKQGSLLPAIQVSLKSTATFDLTMAQQINLVWRLQGSTDRHVGQAAVIDALNKLIQYDWQAGDTDIVGLYEVQVEVIFAGPRTMTFPSTGFALFEIEPTI